MATASFVDTPGLARDDRLRALPPRRNPCRDPARVAAAERTDQRQAARRCGRR
jgi:hypothetical protein